MSLTILPFPARPLTQMLLRHRVSHFSTQLVQLRVTDRKDHVRRQSVLWHLSWENKQMLCLQIKKTPSASGSLTWLFASFLMFISPQLLACNIFVSTTGSDSNSGLTSGNPLQTIQAAADIAINPGDIVCVRPGIYFENNQAGPGTTIKGIKPQASGNPGNPIVFQADPNYVGTVVIDQQFELSAAPSASFDPTDVVGFYVFAHDHITIRGFEIRNVTTGILTKANNSPQAGGLGAFDPPSFITVENNHIHSIRRDRAQSGFDSNIGAVRPNDCYDCTIRGNRLHDVALIDLSGNDEFDNQNSCGIHSFGMLRTVIENNEIFDVHTGVFQKGWTNQPLPGNANYDFVTPLVPPAIDPNTDFGMVVRRNLIHNSIWGIRLSPSGGSGRIIANSGSASGNPAHHNAQIYENIFYSTDAAVQRFG
ncbi:MAG TPA: hypothetical protein DCZ03_10485, partial [Gammaproteobacteria bacterium]|nr:hypothetical protein [Gammaproteobacteria bacterium]